MSIALRRRRILRGTTLPPLWNTGIASSGAGTVSCFGPFAARTASSERASYHTPLPGKYTSAEVFPAAVTGLTSSAPPSIQASSTAKALSSCGNSTKSGRMTGAPVIHASAKAV